MKFLVACDRQSLVVRILDSLGDCGHHASDVHTTSIDDSVFRVGQYRPSVVILGMGEADPESLLEEIKEAAPVRILVIGPTIDPKQILRVLHAGADQYIDDQNLAEELPRSLTRIRSDVPAKVEQGHVITVLGATGGCGASTIAASVSAAISRIYGSCGLIDLRLEAGDLGAMLGLDPPNSVASFCENLHKMDGELFGKCLAKHRSGISLLAAPSDYRDARKVTTPGIRKALTMTRSRFPFVVIDLDPSFQEKQAQVLVQSDTILVVMRLDFTTIRRIRRLLDYVNSLKIPVDRLRFAVNRYRRASEMKTSDVKKSLGIDIFKVIPEDTWRVSHANNLGVPIALHKPRSKVARAINEIATSVNGKSHT